MDEDTERQLRRRILQLEQENYKLRKSCKLPSTKTVNKCLVTLGKHKFEEPGSYLEVRKRYPYAQIEEM